MKYEVDAPRSLALPSRPPVPWSIAVGAEEPGVNSRGEPMPADAIVAERRDARLELCRAGPSHVAATPATGPMPPARSRPVLSEALSLSWLMAWHQMVPRAPAMPLPLTALLTLSVAPSAASVRVCWRGCDAPCTTVQLLIAFPLPVARGPCRLPYCTVHTGAIGSPAHSPTHRHTHTHTARQLTHPCPCPRARGLQRLTPQLRCTVVVPWSYCS